MNFEMEEYLDDDAMVMEPREQFDKCIIGVTYYGDKVVYSTEMILQALMEDNEMTDEEALEYFEYNVIGAYVGEGTPIYIR
jgi:hypothetical protein